MALVLDEPLQEDPDRIALNKVVGAACALAGQTCDETDTFLRQWPLASVPLLER